MRLLGLLLTLLLLFTGCDRNLQVEAFPEPDSLPAIQVQVSNSTPKIGEPVDVTIRVSGAKRLVLPPVDNWLDPSLEILERSSEITETENRWQQQQQLKVALFQITNLVLFAESSVNTLADEPEEIALPFERLDVQSILSEEDALPMFGNDRLPDFRGSEALKRQKRNLMISAVAAAVVVLLSVLAAWWSTRRPKKLPPPVPPHKIALQEIEQLTQTEIWQRPDVDASAVALSLILRQYIEGAFDIRAPEQTTEEFLESAAEKAPWSSEDQVGLQQFFDVTDQIKFAGSRPGSAVLEDLRAAACAFVEKTSRQEQEAAG